MAWECPVKMTATCPVVAVLERIKLALRIEGTGSYVEWAKKVREEWGGA